MAGPAGSWYGPSVTGVAKVNQKQSAAMIAAAFAVLLLLPSSGRAADRPVLIELFTAQGCSSCPPADELLNELVRTRKDLLPLSFHVDYWNRLGWNDPFSSPEATERQRAYASRSTDPTLFTPQMIVDGTQAVIGSDVGQVDEAVGTALDEVVTLAPVSLTTSGKEVVVAVGPAFVRAGATGADKAEIVLIGYDRAHTTAVSRGENTGRKLTEMNVVRSIQSIGDWTGAAVTLRRPAPAGQLRAVLLAAPDGRIVGLAAPGH